MLRKFVHIAAVVMAGAVSFAPTTSTAAELVLTSEVPATHWKTGYMEQFGKLVEEKTGGDLTVKIFTAGQLYSDQDALAALGTGGVHMVWPVSVRLETIAPEVGVMNLPFALSDDAMLNECFNGGLTEMVTGMTTPRGLKVLGLLRAADLFFISHDIEINGLEDLVDTKIRITGGKVLLDTMRGLGVSPISMPASEMSTALAQGAIDGVFTSPAGWAKILGTTGKYSFRVPGLALATYSIVVDSAWMDDLPQDQQTAIIEAVAEVAGSQWLASRESGEKNIAEMVSQGGIFLDADAEERARWAEKVEGSAQAFLSEYPEAVKAYSALKTRCKVDG
jgi:C4-dicarboxylate-binding protein DctP